MQESKVDRAIITIEECNELCQALSKFIRYALSDPTLRTTKTDIDTMIIEELVDVAICIDKMFETFEISNTQIEPIYNYKIERFNKLYKRN